MHGLGEHVKHHPLGLWTHLLYLMSVSVIVTKYPRAEIDSVSNKSNFRDIHLSKSDDIYWSRILDVNLSH